MAKLYSICILHFALVALSKDVVGSEICSSQPEHADCQDSVEDHDASSLLSVQISKHKADKSIGKIDSHAAPTSTGKDLQMLQKSGDFPDMGGFKDLMGGLSKKVHDALGGLEKEVIEPAIKQFASELQGILDKVEKLVNALHKQASLYGTAIGSHIKDAGDAQCDKTRALEEQAKATLKEFSKHWEDIQGKIKGGMDTVTTVLDTVGLGERDFALQFKAAINRTEVTSYLKACQARVSDLEGRCHNNDVLKEAFKLANTTLESTRAEVHKFAKGLDFEKTFKSVTAEMSKQVPDLNLESEFKPLVASEGRIVNGITSSVDALITGIGNGIVLCEASMNSAGHNAGVLVALIVTGIATGVLGVW